MAERAGHDRGLERTQIVTAALLLLNEVGYSGLTLRKLAAKLGVKAAALYWHFENKQDLIDAMAVGIMARPVDMDHTDAMQWRELLTVVARHNRNSLRAYRDGAQIMAHANLAREETIRHLEAMLEALSKQGFNDELAMVSFFTVIRFTMGCVFEEQADPRSHDSSISAERFKELQKVTANYPHFNAMIMKFSADPSHGGMSREDLQFERGLAVILDGVAKQLDEYQRSTLG